MTNQSPLVTSTWLAARLSDADVLALDCRVDRVTHPNGPSTFESCREKWQKARIRGAGYVHFVEDLSDPASPLPFTLPSPEHVGRVLGRYGVTENTTLVVYGNASEMAVHRVWWVLSVSGHGDVRVLDGGLRQWVAEGGELRGGPSEFLETSYVPSPAPGQISDRRDVQAAIDDPTVCLVNALSSELFRGVGDQIFGRRGRIPGSVNIPSDDVIDPCSGCFRSVTEIRSIVKDRIPKNARRVIPYCGGGVAASTIALALAIAGRSDVALYDGSLFDWTTDPNAPMVTG